MTPDGALTTLAVFGRTNEAAPLSLMQARDGNFYDTTSEGGTNGGYRTIFRLTTNGVLTSLFSFSRTNGASPLYGPLVQTADDTFYGTTYRGGASNLGTIFRFQITPEPTFQTIRQNDGVATFSWTALAGRSYQMQFKTDLSQTNWSDRGGPLTATNSTASVSDVIGPDRQRFYRGVLLP